MSKARIIKLGIIGCGGIAFGKHMPALAQIENVQMVAFCDIIGEQAENACKQYGCEGAKTYVDYHEMLKDESIEVIHVCTPNRSHADISVAALESDKHVMCEKPMAINYQDAKRMLDASVNTGKKLTIGYQNRYREDSTALHQMCGNGDLGDIYFAKALAIRRRAVPTWGVFLNEKEQGGGALVDIGTHSLDLTLWMMNNYKPKYVVGNTYRKIADQKNTANAWGEWDPTQFTVEDSAFGFITMQNGATIMLESSWALNALEIGEAETVLCGTKAGADMKGGLRINSVEHNQQFTKEISKDKKTVAFFGKKTDNSALTEAKYWINAIINDTAPLVKPEQAIVVTQILDAIYESAKTGKPVYFD